MAQPKHWGPILEIQEMSQMVYWSKHDLTQQKISPTWAQRKFKPLPSLWKTKSVVQFKGLTKSIQLKQIEIPKISEDKNHNLNPWSQNHTTTSLGEHSSPTIITSLHLHLNGWFFIHYLIHEKRQIMQLPSPTPKMALIATILSFNRQHHFDSSPPYHY